MTKDNKIIKDLKERNRKLSRQYRERDIRCFTLERQIEEMKEENQKYKELIDKAIKYYESNQQECVIGRNKDEKLIKEYYLPAQCSKKMLDILKEVE